MDRYILIHSLENSILLRYNFSSKKIYRFNEIKIIRLFNRLEKLIPKFVWKCKWLRIAKQFWKKNRSKFKEFHIWSAFKSYYKATSMQWVKGTQIKRSEWRIQKKAHTYMDNWFLLTKMLKQFSKVMESVFDQWRWNK